MIHARTHKNALGTKPPRRRAGQSRMHPKLPRFITGGAHHSALCRRRANDHRTATQLRVVALFNGSKECVHVQMADHTKHRAGRLPRTPKKLKNVALNSPPTIKPNAP